MPNSLSKKKGQPEYQVDLFRNRSNDPAFGFEDRSRLYFHPGEVEGDRNGSSSFGHCPINKPEKFPSSGETT